MRKESLKNQLGQQLVNATKEMFDFKKALLGLSLYKEGDEITINDTHGTVDGIVANVRVENDDAICFRFAEDGSFELQPYYKYVVQLFKKDGTLSGRTILHTIPIFE